MTAATLYHNSRCSKSRQALALLEARGCEITIVEYLKNPPNKKTLKTLLGYLKIPAKDLIRIKENDFKALSLNWETLSEEAALAVLVDNPKLIERPIVVVGKRAVVARPPERVAELLP